MAFTVEGPPVGKERARVTAHGTFTPAKTRAAEQAVRMLGRASTPGGWSMLGQYRATLRVYFADRRRRDLDNVTKLILDGLNEVAYADDSQVVELHAFRAFDAERPRVEVALELLENTAVAAAVEKKRKRAIRG